MGRKSNAQKALEAEQRKIQHEHERNTHFAGFAMALANKVDPYVSEWSWRNTEANGGKSDMPPLETLFAQFAYDFAIHVMSNTDEGVAMNLEWIKDHVQAIPDMTAWPEQVE